MGGIAKAIAGLVDAQLTIFSDPARNLARVALHDGDTLVAVLFAAPDPVVVARAHVVGMIGSDTSAQVALAGRPRADMPDPGPVVCSCYGVGANVCAALLQEAVVRSTLWVRQRRQARIAGHVAELAALIAQKQVAAE